MINNCHMDGTSVEIVQEPVVGYTADNTQWRRTRYGLVGPAPYLV
jgi:hypothetical protein